MDTGSPSLAKILTMVLFAFSCIGLLLFLWLSFGGTIPFNPQGYEFKVSFSDASQLANQADVRIAGVNVGKVVAKSLNPQGNGTLVTIQLNNKFAPIHRDTKAILREKTILGETYVQLTPGSPHSPMLGDGKQLPRGNVTNAVQLDQIFDALDPKTRAAFRDWQAGLAVAVKGNSQNISDVIGNLPSFAADTTDLLQVLDVEQTAVVGLVRNGGTVFAALNKDPAALRKLIVTAETTFRTTAQNNNAIAATFHVFPTFLDETKATMKRLQGFSQDTDPLIKKLEPVAQNLRPTLNDVKDLAPSLRSFLTNLGPLITASKTGLPATSKVLNGAQPLLASVGPFLEQLNPILSWLEDHQQLTSDFISNGAAGLAAKTTSFGGDGTGHYLRQFQPTGPETLSFASNRDSANRGNTYPEPLWLADPADFSAGGKYAGSFALPSWDCNNTGAGGDGSKPTDPGVVPSLTQTGSPACWVQPSQAQKLLGQSQDFPHVTASTYSNK